VSTCTLAEHKERSDRIFSDGEPRDRIAPPEEESFQRKTDVRMEYCPQNITPYDLF